MSIVGERTLPEAEAAAAFLGSLLGRPLASKMEDKPAPRGYPAAGALYADAGGTTGAVFACDLAVAAGLGAALAMIPAARVAEAVRAKKLDDMLFENFHEICNVITRLFNAPGPSGAHPSALFLSAVHAGSDANAALAVLGKAALRMDAAVTIQGYPPGRMTLALCG